MKIRLDHIQKIAALDCKYFRHILEENMKPYQLEVLRDVERNPQGKTARGVYVDPVESHRKRKRSQHRRVS